MPIQGVVRSLDPSLTVTVEQADVLPSVFETLTWAVEGTRIVPWLASEVLMENDGRAVPLPPPRRSSGSTTAGG